MAKNELFLAGTMWEIPSGFILPTQVAIDNTEFALSCLAFLKTQSNVTH